jgi:omega-amidase
MAGAWEDPVATLQGAEKYVQRAAEAGAGLLCFPEQFATGWHPRDPVLSETPGGPVNRELARLAAKYALPLLGSFVEVTTTHPRNTCVVFDQAGNTVVTYAKIHLFSPSGEDKNYTPGDMLAIFTLGGVRFGIAICYDLRFPPLFHLYALQGIDCIIVPAAWPCPRIRQWELLVATRALENQCYVAGVNRTGTTPIEKYCGHSLITSPTGTVISKAGETDTLLCGEIDTEQVQKVREAFPVLKEYRTDLYSRLMGEQE